MDLFSALPYCPKCGKSDWKEKTKNFRQCQNCGYEMFKNPTIGAAAIILDDEGRLMLLRRAKNPAKGTLSLPGGFCEIKESIEDAVMREVREETGIEIEIENYLFSMPNDYEYKGVDLFPLDFFFACHIKNQDKLRLDTTENSEIVFRKKEEIDPEEIGLPSQRKAIVDYLRLKA